ncbi:MAG: SPOR domain-containing protein, partial [Pseudomonadota bacterium]
PAPATLNEEEDLAMSELPAVAPEPEAGLVSGGPAPDGVADATAIEAALSDETDSEPLVTVTEQAPQPVTLSEAQTAEVLAVATETPEPQQSATDLAVAAALADLGLKPEPAVVKVEAAANAPRVTPRPAMRPVRPQPVSYTAPLAIAVDEVDVTEVPAGTRLVQLGAFGSVDLAREGWAEAEAKYGDVFGDKQRVIQAASSGGREFYRLRVMGFNDLPDARRFCAMIVADGTNCIPVIHQ